MLVIATIYACVTYLNFYLYMEIDYELNLRSSTLLGIQNEWFQYIDLAVFCFKADLSVLLCMVKLIHCALTASIAQSIHAGFNKLSQ